MLSHHMLAIILGDVRKELMLSGCVYYVSPTDSALLQSHCAWFVCKQQGRERKVSN